MDSIGKGETLGLGYIDWEGGREGGTDGKDFLELETDVCV